MIFVFDFKYFPLYQSKSFCCFWKMCFSFCLLFCFSYFLFFKNFLFRIVIFNTRKNTLKISINNLIWPRNKFLITFSKTKIYNCSFSITQNLKNSKTTFIGFFYLKWPFSLFNKKNVTNFFPIHSFSKTQKQKPNYYKPLNIFLKFKKIKNILYTSYLFYSLLYCSSLFYMLL